MPRLDMPWSQYQRARWMRPDAERWEKPTFVRTPDDHETDDTGETSIGLKALQLDLSRVRVAVADLRFALTLDRVLRERKYSDSQPRVPAGRRRGGQWTGGDEDDDSEEGDEGDGESGGDPLNSFAQAADGEASDEDVFDLSDILSALGDELREAFPFLDLLSDDDRAQVQLVSDNNNQNGNPDPFPQIPEQRPSQSEERTAVLRT